MEMTAEQCERFLSRLSVGTDEDCWQWTGGIYKKSGYGYFSIKRQNKLIHRLAYEWHYGPIPAGLMVCHHCDHRSCGNPEHMFLGTTDDNMADMVKKGR